MTDSPLALHGGTPVRSTLLPYARPSIDEQDVQAVSDVLRSSWLTTGPKVEEFEKAFASFTGAKHAVAVNSGTAALHAAMFALGIQGGDPTSPRSAGLRGASEVIVPTMTFASTANAVLFMGGTPVFSDCEEGTLLIDPQEVEKAITDKTKAIIAVDYAGQPCDYDALRAIADRHNIALIADACHSLGGSFDKKNVGTLADLSVFSFHPTKPIATGEGGMITTDDAELASAMRRFRNQGITSDHRERENEGSWFYEMQDLGFNYRLSDIHCALGISQLKNVPAWTKRRQQIAQQYDAAFAQIDAVTPLSVRENVSHAYHLYVVRFDSAKLSKDRSEIFDALRAENIGVNVHYIPVHLHPYYQKHLRTSEGMCPTAEQAYSEMISLPMFAGMSDDDVQDVMKAVQKVVAFYSVSRSMPSLSSVSS